MKIINDIPVNQNLNVKRGYLVDFLNENRAESPSMLYAEYDYEAGEYTKKLKRNATFANKERFLSE